MNLSRDQMTTWQLDYLLILLEKFLQFKQRNYFLRNNFAWFKLIGPWVVVENKRKSDDLLVCAVCPLCVLSISLSILDITRYWHGQCHRPAYTSTLSLSPTKHQLKQMSHLPSRTLIGSIFRFHPNNLMALSSSISISSKFVDLSDISFELVVVWSWDKEHLLLGDGTIRPQVYPH